MTTRRSRARKRYAIRPPSAFSTVACLYTIQPPASAHSFSLNRPQRDKRGALRCGDTDQPADIHALVAAFGPQRGQTGATLDLPQLHRPVKAAAGEELAVTRER